jgi:hypothetical protein
MSEIGRCFGLRTHRKRVSWVFFDARDSGDSGLLRQIQSERFGSSEKLQGKPTLACQEHQKQRRGERTLPNQTLTFTSQPPAR